MFSQPQSNSLLNLQKQTTYGLSRMPQNINKDATAKSVLRNKPARKSNMKQPLAPQDLNQSSSKSLSKDRSAKQVRISRAAQISGRGTTEKSLSPVKTTSPSLGNSKKRTAIIRSPATTSVQSSGKKTPCISALVQSQQIIDMKGCPVASRYEIVPNRIAEVEHDSSSFLAAEREARLAVVDESNSHADESRSQLSQSLIGAHLVNSKDLYPYCRPEVFQTPQPIDKSFQSPMTSFRNLQSSNILSGRIDKLQMSQKTNVTTKFVSNPARICYEKDSFASQTISPILEREVKNFANIQQSEFNRVQQSQQQQKLTSSITRSPPQKNFLLDRSREISDLALNGLQQNSPERADSAKEIQSPSNVAIDCDGRVMVFANQLGQKLENSYDQDNGTRLMDESAALSPEPEPTNKLLNPYYICEDQNLGQSSNNQQTSKFSSLSKQQHLINQSTSPNIKIEPVKVTQTQDNCFQQKRNSTSDAFNNIAPSVPSNMKLHKNHSSQKDQSKVKQKTISQQSLKSPERKKTYGSLQNSPIQEASRSPSKTSTLKSPSPMGKSPQPAMQQLYVISVNETEQSPEVAIPIAQASAAEESTNYTDMRSQTMYESLMQQHKESEQIGPAPKQIVHAIITEEDENCATISASDISIRVTDSQRGFDHPSAAAKNSAQRAKSSQLPSRRRRDERKTPTGRSTATFLEKFTKTKDERLPLARRSKYPQTNATGPATATVLDQSIGSTDAQTEAKQSSNGAQQRRPGMKKSLSQNACEQTRLANLAKARKYGNRASELNKSGSNLRQETSPTRQQADQANQNSNKTLKGRRTGASNSPSKPEILSVTDLSVMISNPATTHSQINHQQVEHTSSLGGLGYVQPVTSNFNTSFNQHTLHGNNILQHKQNSQNTRSNQLQNNRRATNYQTRSVQDQSYDVERKNRRRNSISSQQYRNKHEVKMSRAASIAKAEFMKKQGAATKIQQYWREYVAKKAEYERQLVLQKQQEAIRAHMAYISAMAARIQRAYRVYRSVMGFRSSVQRRIRLKMIISDLCQAWRTRRSLNCLGTEVQEFVNCENTRQRVELRKHFHMLFTRVVSNKLYLESNFDRLQKFKQQIATKMRQSKNRGRLYKPSSANRTRHHVHKQPSKNLKQEQDSPFKKPKLQQQSPANQNSIISLQNMNESSHASVNHAQRLPVPRLQSSGHNSNPRSKESLPPQPQPRSSNMNSQTRQPQQVTSSRLLNSAGSVGSQPNIGPCDEAININLVRNSFDSQAITQLRDFIQTSGRKSDKYCQIQFTNGLNNEKIMTLQMNSNGTNTQDNSHVMVQVHNKSLQDIISPANQNKSSTVALPGSQSCHRISQQRIPTTGDAPELAEASNLLQKPSISKLTGANSSTAGFSNHERRPQHEQPAIGGEYRQNLRKVRPRVDCWNRSTTRGDTTRDNASRVEFNRAEMQRTEVSPHIQRMNQTMPRSDQNLAKDLQTVRLEQRHNIKSDSAIKTPVQNKWPAANITQPLVGSFSNAAVGRTPFGQNNSASSKQAICELESRSRSTNIIVPSSQQRTNSKSLLREPTKFYNKSLSGGLENQNPCDSDQKYEPVEVRRINAISYNNARSSTPMMNSASRNNNTQQLRPKSSRQQMQSSTQNSSHQQSASNLRQFINVAKSNDRKTGNQKVQAPVSIQTQILQMRETMAQLNQVMEQIATEADTRQRDQTKNSSGFGLNSQHRAAVKSLTNQEKIFNGLISQVCESFISFKDRAMPNNPGGHGSDFHV